MNSKRNGVHSHFVPTVLVLLYLFMARTTIAVVEVHNINTDQSSLLAFKDNISYDANDFLAKNWSAKTPICKWFGVTCDSFHLRVTSLNLSYMGLAGTISPHLGNLSFLRKLDLSNNAFHGSLPSEMTQLRRIKLIRLNFNHISGEIPSWFVFLTKLKLLELRYNNFTGMISHSIFNITSLQKLNLAVTNFGVFYHPTSSTPLHYNI
ncbi:hypothetical protein L6164_002650 [Bauhinia variegata]|uniref:Uncharacterized protein n=1 Tax=Bauhinia variegata TaxID=167791 RepID=A0ACB9Q0Q4_BAUVA|nr:hypothetical protein L6164_002650 [Bauhinia variegata]